MITSTKIKLISGKGHDVANKIITTYDGGYLITGQTSSNDGSFKKSRKSTSTDIFAIKLNTDLNTEWLKKYGGSGSEVSWDVIQTSEGGYVLAGVTDSKDLDFKNNATGKYDSIFLQKIDYMGHLEWVRFYGGVGFDFCRSFIQTKDGGFMLTGGSSSEELKSKFISKFNFLKTSTDQKSFILKVNHMGNYEWLKRFDGSAGEFATSICEAHDDGFVLTGGVIAFEGYTFIRKVNNRGDIVWEKKLRGNKTSNGNSIIKSRDDSYVFTGATEDNSGSFSRANYGKIVIGKIDLIGNIIWLNTFGGGNLEGGDEIIETDDEGFLVTGNSQSNSGHFQNLNKGNFDAFVLKVDKDGEFKWVKNFGGSNIDSGNSITKSVDNSYVITGHTNSNDLDFSNNKPGKMGIFILKIALGDLASEATHSTSNSSNEELLKSIEKLSKGQKDLLSEMINNINK